MIKVNQYIETAFSMEDANILLPIIEKELEEIGKVELDFTGIEIFTTLFFNNTVANYVMRLSPKEFDSKFNFYNLSEIGKTTYQHSYDNAVEYYKLPEEKREEQDAILEEQDD